MPPIADSVVTQSPCGVLERGSKAEACSRYIIIITNAIITIIGLVLQAEGPATSFAL